MVIYYLLYSKVVLSMYIVWLLYGMSNRFMCNFIKNFSSNFVLFWCEFEIYNIK